jgi:hypothetical protein
MSGVQRSSALQLKQHAIFDQKVRSEFTDFVTAKPDWQRYLTIRSKSCLMERNHERFLVHTFQKSIAEFIVNIVKDPDDFLSNVSMLEYYFDVHRMKCTAHVELDP